MPEGQETQPLTQPIEISSDKHQVALKQYTPDDAEEAFTLIDRNRKHLSQFGDETAAKYPTLESFRESISNPKNPKRLRFSIRNKEGELVGSINVTPDNNNPQRGEVGYYLGEEFQKKGYTGQAVELLTDYAFEHLGYLTLYGEVTEGNNTSIRVLERAGYKETKRQDGKIVLTKEKPANSQIATIDTTLGMSKPELMRDVFSKVVTPDKKAVIVTGTVSGTVHENLLPLIRETTQKGTPVFVLATNYRSKEGIQELGYDSHSQLIDSGAVLLKNVNVNQTKETAEAIQAEIDQGKKSQQLKEAIVERFGSPAFTESGN